MQPIQSIAFVAFPQVGEQDLLVPWELFRALSWSLAQQGRKLDVVLASFEEGPIATHMGTTVMPERVLKDSDRFDMVYIPGGVGGGAQSKNPQMLQWVQAHKAEGRWVAANCAGMAVLHKAGVLEGLEVTSSATLARKLVRQGTRVLSPRRAWKIDPANKLFSAGGAGTVHPSTIALAWHLFGDEAGRALAAGWDATPLFGESLFALEGPVMRDDEQVKSQLQDTWENVFLPS